MSERSKCCVPYGFAAIALMLCGCTTGITSRPVIDQVSNTEGIFYTLPKTYLKFTAKFNLWVEEPATNGPAPRHGVLLLDEKEGLTVTPILRPDPDQRYLLVSKEGGWSDVSDYLVKISSNGSLETVNASYENKAADVAGNLISTAITIAKAVVLKSSTATLRAFNKTDKSITFTHTYAVDEFSRKNENAAALTLTSLKTQVAGVNQGTNTCTGWVYEKVVLDDEMKALKSAVVDDSVTDFRLAYPGFKWLNSENGNFLGIGKIRAVLQCGAVSNSPSAEAVGNKLGGYNFLWWWKNDIIPGVVYRAPVRASLNVEVEGTPVLDTEVDVYQYGNIGYMDVRSHAFSKRTEKLALSNGRVTQHEKSATSSVATATKLLSEQMPNLISAIQSLITAVNTNAPSRACK